MIALILEATCELNYILGIRKELTLVKFDKMYRYQYQYVNQEMYVI